MRNTSLGGAALGGWSRHGTIRLQGIAAPIPFQATGINMDRTLAIRFRNNDEVRPVRTMAAVVQGVGLNFRQNSHELVAGYSARSARYSRRTIDISSSTEVDLA